MEKIFDFRVFLFRKVCEQCRVRYAGGKKASGREVLINEPYRRPGLPNTQRAERVAGQQDGMELLFKAEVGQISLQQVHLFH